MRIGIIGSPAYNRAHSERLLILTGQPDLPIQSMKEWCWNAHDHLDAASEKEIMHWMEDLDLVFISTPSAYSFYVAQCAVRGGLHLFLDRKSFLSIREYNELLDLAEEAGSEIGVSRPWRYHPLFDMLPATRNVATFFVEHTLAGLAHLEEVVPPHPYGSTTFFRSLVDAMDLCCFFAHSGEVRDIDTQLIQSNVSPSNVLLAGIRFQNGVYAHIHVRDVAGSPRHMVSASMPGFQLEADLLQQRIQTVTIKHSAQQEENDTTGRSLETTILPPYDLLIKETKAYLSAIATGSSVPTSGFDALQTARLTERLRRRLR